MSKLKRDAEATAEWLHEDAGEPWTIDVFNNLGWHGFLRHPMGYSMSRSEHSGLVFISSGPSWLVKGAEGKTPQEAIARFKENITRERDQLDELLATFESYEVSYKNDRIYVALMEHPERWDASWVNWDGSPMAAYSRGRNSQTSGFSRGWNGYGLVERGMGRASNARCPYPPGSYGAASWYAGRDARRLRDAGKQ